MSEAIDSARRLVKDRLCELEAEARQLERALKALGIGIAVGLRLPSTSQESDWQRARPLPGAPRPAPRQLLAAIKAKPGARSAELAGEIGIPPSQVFRAARQSPCREADLQKGAGYAVKA